MARGVDGRDVFIDENDGIRFLSVLERLKRQTQAIIRAYCLMGNHFHLAIEVGPVDLAAIMQRLLTSYSITFNNRHDRAGHLFQARYKAILCNDDSYLIGLIQYIHMNPVRAGFVVHPKEWRWSSYNDYRRSDTDSEISSLHDPVYFDPWSIGKENVRPGLIRSNSESSPSLSDIGASISSQTGISVGELRSGTKRRSVVDAKRLLVNEAVKNGHRLLPISRWLGTTLSAVAHYVGENNLRNYRPDT